MVGDFFWLNSACMVLQIGHHCSRLDDSANYSNAVKIAKLLKKSTMIRVIIYSILKNLDPLKNLLNFLWQQISIWGQL